MRYRTVFGVLVVAIGVQTFAAPVKDKQDAKITIQYRRTDITAAAEQAAFAFDAFGRIEIDAGAGADFVNIIDPAQRLDAKRKGLDIAGGDGDNIVAITRAPFAPETAMRMRSLLDVSRAWPDWPGAPRMRRRPCCRAMR